MTVIYGSRLEYVENPKGLLLAMEGSRVAGCLYIVCIRTSLFGVDLKTRNAWITLFFVDSYAPHNFLSGIDPNAYPEGMVFFREARI